MFEWTKVVFKELYANFSQNKYTLNVHIFIMPAVPTLEIKLHTDTQYGRSQLASWIGVHNLSISDRSIVAPHHYIVYLEEKCKKTLLSKIDICDIYTYT